MTSTLTKEAYLRAASELVAWFRASDSRVEDLDFITDREVFSDARELAEHTDLDLSDAFQLLSLQVGYFSHLVGGSATLLVAADKALADAARKRGLPVWDCRREAMPRSQGRPMSRRPACEDRTSAGQMPRLHCVTA